MPNYNNVQLMGHLTRDPELRFANSGLAICECGLAYNYKNKDTEKVTFVDFTVFDKKAELVANSCRKGDPIFIAGYLDMDQWTDKATGQPRSKLKVVAQEVQLIGGTRKAAPAAPPASEPEPPEGTFRLGDDIPF